MIESENVDEIATPEVTTLTIAFTNNLPKAVDEHAVINSSKSHKEEGNPCKNQIEPTELLSEINVANSFVE